MRGSPGSDGAYYFLSCFHSSMNSSVTLHPTYPSSDLLQLQVQIDPMPAHFLGTAFDMVLDGNWKFERFELCGDFVNDHHVIKLVAALPHEHKVVVGVSVPDTKDKVWTGNCLGTFTFRLPGRNRSPSRVDFEHGYLSVYNHGRQDLPQTTWRSLLLPTHGLHQQKTQQDPGDTSFSQEMKDLSTGAVAKSNILLPFDAPLARFYETMGIFLLLMLLFFLLLALYFYFRKAFRDDPSKKS